MQGSQLPSAAAQAWEEADEDLDGQEPPGDTLVALQLLRSQMTVRLSAVAAARVAQSCTS